jgi:hypothetical protein
MNDRDRIQLIAAGIKAVIDADEPLRSELWAEVEILIEGAPQEVKDEFYSLCRRVQDGR